MTSFREVLPAAPDPPSFKTPAHRPRCSVNARSPVIFHLHPDIGPRMAKPNYAHQKKQREEAARRKREAKQQRRQPKKDEPTAPVT